MSHAQRPWFASAIGDGEPLVNDQMKKVFITSAILAGTGCNTHPDVRCFGASTPTDLHLKNTGRNTLCATIEAERFAGDIIKDKVCLDSQEVSILCYELEDLPAREVIVRINSEEIKIALSPTARNEIDYSTIKK